MALSWILKDKRITTVLIGASKPEQITDSIKALDNIEFSDAEIKLIDEILK
ncbi:L-glyceraldehyde 3-phosphate reductase [compost metagenome]